MGGALVRGGAGARAASCIPVDSEHSAALQCLGGRPPAEVAAPDAHRLGRRAARASRLAARDARGGARAPGVEHGPAHHGRLGAAVQQGTRADRGARCCSGSTWERLDAVLHPQAVVHALVAFRDGSTVVQAAPARHAAADPAGALVAGALGRGRAAARPGRARGARVRADRTPARFPAFDLALAAGRAGGTAPCALNAADEVAVAAFLDGAIPLGRVPRGPGPGARAAPGGAGGVGRAAGAGGRLGAGRGARRGVGAVSPRSHAGVVVGGRAGAGLGARA